MVHVMNQNMESRKHVVYMLFASVAGGRVNHVHSCRVNHVHS